MTVKEYWADRRKCEAMGIPLDQKMDHQTMKGLLAQRERVKAGKDSPVGENGVKREIPPHVLSAFRVARREAPNAIKTIESWLDEVLDGAS